MMNHAEEQLCTFFEEKISGIYYSNCIIAYLVTGIFRERINIFEQFSYEYTYRDLHL